MPIGNDAPMAQAHVPPDPGLPSDGAASSRAPDNTQDVATRTPSSTRRRRLRRVLIAAVALVVALVLVVGGSYAWVRIDASAHQFTLANAPSADVALVLGAGLRADGTPSEYLRYRLDDAAALFKAGKVKVLLVSGDNRTTEHDEPSAMRDYLVAQGVPVDKVVLDFAGQDTYDSCFRAKEIFGVTRLLVVTQQFHLSRAVFLCRQVGIDTDGVADPHPLVTSSPEIREVPAAVKAAWDAIWQPDPRHLGPHEDGVTTALAGG